MPKTILHTFVEKIEEKFKNIEWKKLEDGTTTFTRVSLGWYIQFQGSSESIHLFDTKPDWAVGDKVQITFERIKP